MGHPVWPLLHCATIIKQGAATWDVQDMWRIKQYFQTNVHASNIAAGYPSEQCRSIAASKLGRHWNWCWQRDVWPQCFWGGSPVSHCRALLPEEEGRAHCCYVESCWSEGSSVLRKLHWRKTCNTCESFCVSPLSSLLISFLWIIYTLFEIWSFRSVWFLIRNKEPPELNIRITVNDKSK